MIQIICPYCKKPNGYNLTFEVGHDHVVQNSTECDECGKDFGFEVVSENIYVEATWKNEDEASAEVLGGDE